jgi:ferritin-like metal-binding protein YciE
MSLDTMRDLLIAEMSDVLNAEKQLLKALPKMVRAASSPTLKKAFTTHLAETKKQVTRLDQAFAALGERPLRKKCKGMEGLLAEGAEMAQEDGDDAVRDAGLICAAQRVEHYEIAAYGGIVTFAELLGETKVARLMEQTLAEEEKADSKLSTIAEGEINDEALAAGDADEDEE